MAAPLRQRIPAQTRSAAPPRVAARFASGLGRRAPGRTGTDAPYRCMNICRFMLQDKQIARTSAGGRRWFRADDSPAKRNLSENQAPMVNHQTPVLDDLDSRAGKLFRRPIVAYSELKPDRSRLFGNHVIDVHLDILRAPKHV